MTKVLHLFPRFATGGAERLVLQYADFLNRQNFEIAAGSTVEDGELRFEFVKSGIELFVGSRKKQGGRWGVWRECEKFVRAWQPDIIHTHLLGADLFGYFLKKRFGSKWIVTLHNLEQRTSFPRRLIWKFILRKADKIIAVSQKVYIYSKQEFNLSEEQLILIPNGIILEPWSAVPDLNLSGEKLRIAAIGRLVEQKGHKYLLSALGRADFSWELHIFGEGCLEKQLKQQAVALKIADKIVWHGVVADISTALKNIDVVIQPSLWEGLSLTVMEAMAAGRLVIVSKPAGEDLIKNRQTGLLFNVEDVNGLVEAIKWVMADKNRAKIIANAGRQYAVDNFGLEKNVEKMKQVYKIIRG